MSPNPSVQRDGMPPKASVPKAAISANADASADVSSSDALTLSEEDIRRCLPLRYGELPIHVFDTLDSTNIRARELALDGAPHGTVVIAHRQTGGRGRLGRSFFSPRDGLYMTVLLRPGAHGFEQGRPLSVRSAESVGFGFELGRPLPVRSAESVGSGFELGRPLPVTPAAAVAVAESIEEICGVSAGIKWVNDIYVRSRKVCGILTEGITHIDTGRLDCLAVGIGINTFSEELPPELQEIAGVLEGDYSRAALAASVITKLLDFADQLAVRSAALDRPGRQSTAPDEAAPLPFMDTYRQKSLVLGKTVTIYKGAYSTDPRRELAGRPARVLDIDDEGGLCVLYTDGARETLTSGEISIRL